MPSLPAEMKVLLTLEKQELNFSRCALFHMKTSVSLKYFVSYCMAHGNWFNWAYNVPLHIAGSNEPKRAQQVKQEK